MFLASHPEAGPKSTRSTHPREPVDVELVTIHTDEEMGDGGMTEKDMNGQRGDAGAQDRHTRNDNDARGRDDSTGGATSDALAEKDILSPDGPPADPTAVASSHSSDTLLQYARRQWSELIRVGTSSYLLLLELAQWLVLVVPLGCLVGVACSVFLYTINRVTIWRFDQPWLLYVLPVSGVLQAILYRMFAAVPPGTRAYGVDFIIDQMHAPNAVKGRFSVPWRMGPLAWLTTLMSHVCGASVGREGTGLQIAASIGSFYAWLLRELSGGHVHVGRHRSRLIGIAAMSAGFSSLFGTPFTGVVFSLEVLVVGPLVTDAFVPCLIASCSASLISKPVMSALSTSHSDYALAAAEHEQIQLKTFVLVCVAAIFFGIVARLFTETIHLLQRVFQACVPTKLKPIGFMLIPAVGGALVIAFTFALNTRDYLGIGTLTSVDAPHAVLISSCFVDGGDCHAWSFAAKFLLTTISLAAGFKGGEVTSLFYIGAASGYAVAQAFNQAAQTQLYASLGLVGVFAAAANTPLASTIMACELYGGTHVVYYALSCYIAYVVSGRSGIYKTQKYEGRKLLQVAESITVS